MSLLFRKIITRNFCCEKNSSKNVALKILNQNKNNEKETCSSSKTEDCSKKEVNIKELERACKENSCQRNTCKIPKQSNDSCSNKKFVEDAKTNLSCKIIPVYEEPKTNQESCKKEETCEETCTKPRVKIDGLHEELCVCNEDCDGSIEEYNKSYYQNKQYYLYKQYAFYDLLIHLNKFSNPQPNACMKK